MTDIKVKADRLLRRLKVEMNGAVSGAMKERGMVYKLNYGVSIPTLKAITAEYGPDHTLAMELFGSDIRELKLAAIYVADPKAVKLEQLEEWGDNLVTTEVAEHLAIQLLGRSPLAVEVARRWLPSGDKLKVYAASMGLASALKRGAARACDKDLGSMFEACASIAESNDKTLASGVINLLRAIALTGEKWMAKVVKFVEEAAGAGSPAKKYVAEELSWRLYN